MEKVNLSSFMSKLFCITDLIRFMMKESDKLMKGSVHQENFFILHDALVLMTLKETRKWMKENNFHLWLLPMNGFQDGTPYSLRPVSNSPVFMSLDNSLNRYSLHSLLFQCVLSSFLLDGEGTDEEERNTNFSFSTPK